MGSNKSRRPQPSCSGVRRPQCMRLRSCERRCPCERPWCWLCEWWPPLCCWLCEWWPLCWLCEWWPLCWLCEWWPLPSAGRGAAACTEAVSTLRGKRKGSREVRAEAGGATHGPSACGGGAASQSGASGASRSGGAVASQSGGGASRSGGGAASRSGLQGVWRGKGEGGRGDAGQRWTNRAYGGRRAARRSRWRLWCDLLASSLRPPRPWSRSPSWS